MYNGFRLKAYIVLLIILLVLAYLVANLVFAEKAPQEPFVSLESCSYHQPNIVYIPDYQVLGIEVDKTLYNIIRCESGFDPTVCNLKYGCGSGMGMCMFITITWLETIDRMGELLPERCRNMEAVFDGECNLIACKWLYETDGDVHWREWSGECYLK